MCVGSDMTETGYIYALTTSKDTTFRYIGKTTIEPKYRLKQHISTARHERKTPVQKWILKRESENLKIEIVVLDEANVVDLDDLEIEYIQALREDNGDCREGFVSGSNLNVNDGGTGGGPSTVTDSQIDEMLTGFDRTAIPRMTEHSRWATKFGVSVSRIAHLMNGLGTSPKTKGDPRLLTRPSFAGENNPTAKLTETIVLELRQKRATEGTFIEHLQAWLKAEHNITLSYEATRKAVVGLTWKGV